MTIFHQDFFGSSNVDSADFDDEDGVVTVTFRNGRTYEADCDALTWTKFKEAPSPGSFVRGLGLVES